MLPLGIDNVDRDGGLDKIVRLHGERIHVEQYCLVVQKGELDLALDVLDPTDIGECMYHGTGLARLTYVGP